ncbi:MAG: hypothetical protein HC810_06885 [Acaryochloridaceae cyanobacterium RL_2_7]|nr:hypothetical protein [Acaryochloridaceae cyanobacterium RL_2_7]
MLQNTIEGFKTLLASHRDISESEFMYTSDLSGLEANHSAFETSVNQAILKSGLALKKNNIEFDPEKSSWEWVGYVAPQFGHWVTIHRENSLWHLSAITEQCGVLKIIHQDLAAALTELKLVSNVVNGNI